MVKRATNEEIAAMLRAMRIITGLSRTEKEILDEAAERLEEAEERRKNVQGNK